MTISLVAKKIGLHPITLRHELLSGNIAGITKDRNGWWVIEPQDIERISKLKNHRYYPNRNQKKINENT